MTNKRYPQLSDLDWLFSQLKEKSMSRLAKVLAKDWNTDPQSLAGCIRFMVQRYFSPEQISQIKKERIFHRNKRRKVDTISSKGN